MTRMKQFHRKREMLSEESKEAAGYCAFLSEQLQRPGAGHANADYEAGFRDALKAYRELICTAFNIEYNEAVVLPTLHYEKESENQ